MKTCWRIVFELGIFLFTLSVVDCFHLFVLLFAICMYEMWRCVYVIFDEPKNHTCLCTQAHTKDSTNSFQFDLCMYTEERKTEQQQQQQKIQNRSTDKKIDNICNKSYFRHGISLLCTNRTSSTSYFHCGKLTHAQTHTYGHTNNDKNFRWIRLYLKTTINCFAINKITALIKWEGKKENKPIHTYGAPFASYDCQCDCMCTAFSNTDRVVVASCTFS